MSEPEKKRGPGRPPKKPRVVRSMSPADYDEALKHIRAFNVGGNKKDPHAMDNAQDLLVGLMDRLRDKR